MQYIDFYRQVLAASQSAGLPVISIDTAAQICAVLLVVGGNNEEYTLSPKLAADLEYIRNRFHLHGGGTPPADFVDSLKYWTDDLKQYAEYRRDGFPEWAVEQFRKRYGIKLKNYPPAAGLIP